MAESARRILMLMALALAMAGCGSARPAKDAASQARFGIEMARRGLWSEALFRFQAAGGGLPTQQPPGTAPGQPGPVASSAVAPLVAPAPAVVVGNEPASAGVPSSLPTTGGLRVEFDDRSWIEIRDATQKIVFVGEYPAGTRQSIEGKAPFQVWIGKASGVRLFMGERSIDLKPHTREEVARFSLE